MSKLYSLRAGVLTTLGGFVLACALGSAETQAQVPQSPKADGKTSNSIAPGAPSAAAPDPAAQNVFRPGAGKLPAIPTEPDRLIAAFSAINPSLGLTDRYVGAVLAERRTNEIARKEEAETESRKIRQAAIVGEFWVAGTITVGAYDRATRSFPVTGWDFPLNDKFLKLRFEPADSTPLIAIGLQPSEAELALAEMPSDRRLRILVRAVPANATASPDQFGPITLFGDVKSAVVWTPRADKRREPFIIARLEPSTTEIKTDPAKPASSLEAATLDPETIDLLLLKHAPQLVTDVVLKHMLVNRWVNERKTPDKLLPPNEYELFFKPGRPAPNEVEAGRLLASFRKWAEAQSARLPARYRVLVSEHVGTFLQCGTFLGAGLRGGWPPAMPAELEGILTDGQFQRLVQSLGKQSNEAFEAARTKEPYSIGPLHYALGKWIKRPAADGQCGSQLFDSASKAARLQVESDKLPIAIVEVPTWTSNNPVPMAISNVVVTGSASKVELVQGGRQPPRLFITLQPEKLEPAKDSATGPQTRGETIDLSSLKNVRNFAIDPRTEGGSDTPRADATPAPAAPSKKEPHAQMDVVGIRTGMSVAQAREMAEKQNEFEFALSFSPKNKSTVTAFSSGTVLISRARNEYIILIHDPLQGDAKVVSIGRFSYEGPGAINEQELLQSLTDKYAVVRQGVASGAVYQSIASTGAGDAARCFVAVGGIAGALEFRDQSGNVATGALMPQELSATMRDVSHIPWIGFQNHYLNKLESLRGCGTNAAAWLPENAGQLSGFVVWITDVGAYADSLSKMLRGSSAATSKRPRL